MDIQQHTAPATASGQPATFVIGQDIEGHWLAIETHGLAGGLFRSLEAAQHYATFETNRRSGAVQLASEPLALRL